MTPAQAMGTFLKVWRSGWAGLSRAQVAVALSSLTRQAVKPDIVRRWEQGQAPGSTDELEALLNVMQRHGLQPREARQLRQAIFVSCLERQYPELFEGDDFAYHKDVDGVSQELFERHWRSGDADTVQVVGMAESLGQAIREQPPGHTSTGQARRQVVALCYLRALIADVHDYGNRPEAAAASWATSREALQFNFGPGGLGGPLTPLYARIREAYSRSYPSNGPCYPKGFGSPVWSARLLDLVEEAEAKGDEGASVAAFFYALGSLDHYGHPQLEAALSRAPEYVKRAEGTGDADGVQQAHVELCITHTRHGHIEEAEKHLSATEWMRSGSALRQAMWYCNLGRLRLAQGNHSAAQEALELGLRAARQSQQRANWDDLIQGFLDRCEREELSARQRTLHPVTTRRHAPRQRRRPPGPKRKPPHR